MLLLSPDAFLFDGAGGCREVGAAGVGPRFERKRDPPALLLLPLFRDGTAGEKVKLGTGVEAEDDDADAVEIVGS